MKAAGEQFGLYLTEKKKEDHDIWNETTTSIVVEGVDQVNSFKFFGSMIVKDGRSSVDIRRRLAMAKSTASILSNNWKYRNVTGATQRFV